MPLLHGLERLGRRIALLGDVLAEALEEDVVVDPAEFAVAGVVLDVADDHRPRRHGSKPVAD